MFDLKPEERFIVIFLILALLLGLVLANYRRLHPPTGLTINKSSIERELGGAQSQNKIKINEAGIEELMSLDGIGETLARRIIEYRASRGPFGSIDDIKDVKGIGDKLFDKIKDDITVE